MDYAVTYTRKVRFSDCDPLGHVFNANYFVYFDDAITDYVVAALGAPYEEMNRRGHDLVLARAECDFRSSGEFGETMVTCVRVERVGNTSITFLLEIVEEQTGRTVAQGREVYVVIDRGTKRPASVPDYLRSAFARLEGQGEKLS